MGFEKKSAQKSKKKIGLAGCVWAYAWACASQADAGRVPVARSVAGCGRSVRVRRLHAALEIERREKFSDGGGLPSTPAG